MMHKTTCLSARAIRNFIRATVQPVESMIGSIIVIVTPVGIASSRVAVPPTISTGRTLDRMETRLKANSEMLRQPREIVEHPFGSMKQWMNQGAFLMCGLVKVRAKFSLTALAYNMTRVLTIVGIERLLKAFQNAKNHASFEFLIRLLPSSWRNFTAIS